MRHLVPQSAFKHSLNTRAFLAVPYTDAPRPLTLELINSVVWVIVVEKHNRGRIRREFKKQRPPDHRIITLNIPDEYERGDPELIELLKSKVTFRIDNLVKTK